MTRVGSEVTLKDAGLRVALARWLVFDAATPERMHGLTRQLQQEHHFEFSWPNRIDS
jgi:hypothetical protein